MVLRNWFLASLIAFLLSATPLLASDRVALVIGNSAYQEVQPLLNPRHDARDLAAKLQELGFEVTVLTDLTKADFENGLRNYSRSVRRAEMALIFYAGHGIGYKGQSWLIPVEAELAYEDEVELEAISANQLLKIAGRARGLGLVILDSCRNNSFKMASADGSVNRSISRGLAKISPSGDTLLWYSAEDGRVAADGSGRNSPFTTALLRQLDIPGLELAKLFREVIREVRQTTNMTQSPTEYGSRTEDFYFQPKLETKLNLVSPQAIEIDLALTRDERRKIQEILTLLEYNPKENNGIFGAQTRHALKRWQKEQGILGEGFLNSTSYNKLILQGKKELALVSSTCNSNLTFESCRKACDNDSARGCNRLGDIFYNGTSVKINYSKARDFYEQACDGDDPWGCINLANMHYNGEGGAKDHSAARGFYKKACDENDAVGCRALAYMLYNGEGGEKDYAVARRLYKKACEGGDPRGCERSEKLKASIEQEI